jgi:hypothetical protein
MGNAFPKLHQIIEIAYNNDPNVTHGGTIISSDVYHKATKWFLHQVNDLAILKKYTQSLDTLELNVFIAFSLLITIREVCMLNSETSFARCEQCGRVNFFFSSQ